MRLAKLISSEIDSLKRRVVKALGRGKSDVQTAYEAMPFGIDSRALKDMIAVFADTEGKGESVIIGYILKNQLQKVKLGETRIYSTDANGVQKFEIYLKDDGTIEIGGSANNLVKYTPLDSGLQNFKTAIQAELVKIQTAISSLGGAYAPGSLSVDISGSKINEIKTL